MTLRQAGDLLKKAKTFHKGIREFYGNMLDVVEDESVKTLLEKWIKHHELLETQLDEYRSAAKKKVLNAWLFYAPDDHKWNQFDDIHIQPDMTVEDVVEVAIQLDDRLLDLYQDMASHADSADVKDVFLSLYKLGLSERNNMVSSVLFLD